MKNYFFLALLCMILPLHAQDKNNHCATDDIHFKELKENTEYKRRFEKNNADWQLYAPTHMDKWKAANKAGSNNQELTTPVTLNVVFHDMSSGTNFLLPSTSTVAGYQYILDNLNLIYNGTNIGGRPAGNNTFINFCLAKTNQQGDTYTFSSTRHGGISAATNIDRTNTNQLNTIVNASTSPTNYTPLKYINVYIVDDIQGAVAGFASLPPSHGTQRDGIFIERQFLQTNLNDNMNVMAHEMGHYLGLYHTFGLCENITVGVGYDCSCDNGNCLFNGDMVCDTPPNVLFTGAYTTSTFPNTCSTDATIYPTSGPNLNPITSDLNDPKENYMDYGNWSLQYRFSPGQITRMQFMVDPLVGVRNSLLGQAACANCIGLNGCAFTINPNITFPASNPRHEITQVGTSTPSVQFSLADTSCSTSLAGQVTYSWSLELLNPHTVTTGSGASYTTTPGLAVGNYLLTITATLNSNAQCFESATYNFVILPQAATCNLVTPNTNTAAAWSALNWNRISFSNGWYYNGSTYPAGSTHATDTQPGFDASGFDVIPITAGNTIGIANDPIMGGVVLPAAANITNVIRVGKITGGGGTAFYAKRTLIINRNNCRFKVWVLGATQGLAVNTQFLFQNSGTTSNDAAFGILSRYRFASPVNNAGIGAYNVTMGLDDTGSIATTRENSVVSQQSTYPYPSLDASGFFSNGGYFKMTGWKEIILDYSEYVDLNVDTEITITFFSHSNSAANALQNAYAYYGIECLGGGVPQNLSFEVPNASISCSSPGTQSCAEFPIPDTISAQHAWYVIGHNSGTYLFDNVKVYKIDQTTGLPSTTPYPITFNYSTHTFKICLDQQDAPFQDFRIVYTTLHQTITDDFRVSIGFYNNIPDCTTGDLIDTAIHPGLINGDILLCGADNLPTLNLTPTCISVPFTYQWYRKNNSSGLFIPITGATNPVLQLAYNSSATWNSGSVTSTNNYYPYLCNTYIRKALYTEPYCSNPKAKSSEEFHIYNKWSLTLKYTSALDNDICFGNTYNLQVVAPSLIGHFIVPNTSSCPLPSHFNADLSSITNHLTFQLYDPATNQVFGNAVNYTFTGPFADGTSISGLNLNFSFNNINPATGNSPLFVPTLTNSNFPISIRITGDYLGCTLDAAGHTAPIQDINFSLSAVGGSIAYNCTANADISSQNDGITYGGYAWEYSSTPSFSTLTTISGATSSTLSASIVNSLSLPVYIRRRSNGTGQCLAPAYSNVVYLSSHPASVIFDSITYPTTICLGGTAPVLSNTSSNGILGTWNVATVSNQIGQTYVFTPLQGYCLPPYNYVVTVVNAEAPTFPPVGPFCAGTNFTLPTTSTNTTPITGYWTPAINNMATTTYTFHPNSSGNSCSNNVTIVVVINPSTPVSFVDQGLFQPICYGTTAPVLPTTDDNGVEGTWSPLPVSNTLGGPYTFTPTNNTCVTPATYTIGIIQQCGFTISWGSEVSCQYITDGRKHEVNIVDGPCLRVCENSIIHYELHGDLSSIASTDWNITGGTISNPTNTSCDIQWSNATYCALQGVIHLTNGTQVNINKCIEKLEAPHASFGVFPLGAGEYYSTCINTPTYFENYSYADSGDDNLYYNWYFSDGTTSNEFEPVHIFHEPGTYTINLVVSNGCSCVDRVTGAIYVGEGDIKIDCPSVTCQGSRETYTIDSSYANCPDVTWQVEGGTVLALQNNNTQAQILWGTGNTDGFGYITVTAGSCSQCASIVKIPIIQQVGTIKGDLNVCQKTQNLYSLPQWPTTDFNWSLVDNGTGAVLLLTGQRNEIILQSQSEGVVELYCSYTNTLLGCGGTAHLTIHVQPGIRVSGPTTICAGTPTNYNLVDNAGSLIPNVTWTITGPSSFQESGTSNPIVIDYTVAGVYYINASEPNHCGVRRFELTIKPQPATPGIIDGPLVVCPGTPVTYSVTPTSGATPHWSVNNGTIIGSSIGNSILVNFNPLATSNFVVQVYYEQDGCNSTTKSITIGRDLPNLTVTHSDTTVCGSTYGDYSIANTQADSYTWSIQPSNAGSIESGQNTNGVHILWNQQAQTATVNLELRKCGQLYTLTTPITVTIISTPTIAISGASSICSGNAANFSFTQTPSGTFTSVLWDYGDGTTGTTAVASHQYQTPLAGSVSYTVSATVTGANGCPMNAVATTNIVVSPSPVVAVTPAVNLNLCASHDPGDYTYSVTMQGGFAATDIIKWYRNGSLLLTGSGPSAATINVQTYGIGSYYATVTNSYMCTSTTNTFTVFNNCGGCAAPQVVNAVVESNMTCQHVLAYPTALPAGYTSVNWITSLPGATILHSDATSFEAENVAPGEYPLQFAASYNYNGQNCSTAKNLTFIVPYKANLKYQLSCGAGNTYQVKLFDFSTYYSGTPITQWWFTIDGGSNWYAGTAGTGGVQQYTANLSPGTYTVGIRIARAGFAACEEFLPLIVPGKPNPSFTNEATVCAGSPIHFALIPQAGYQYSWDFGDGSFNLLPNPSKTYAAGGLKSITLTITDQYGCSVTSPPHVVNVYGINMSGSLAVTPANVCQGGQMMLNFSQAPGSNTPTSFNWYQNTVTPTPFATTTSSSLSVTQNGQYLIHLIDSHGCEKNNLSAATVAFTPIPATPVITGSAIACANSPIKLKVPANSTVTYAWSLNNVVQPQWNNLNSITSTQSAPGTYVFSVVATVNAGGTTYCSSTAGSFSVNVVAAPDVPVLSLNTVVCDPYQVEVVVTNPQTDVGYYWSNGDTGTSTLMLHDGPLQVRAVINECVSKSQLDLPIDLATLAWVFPKGCFESCDKPDGYILGPLGSFEKWEWLENDNIIVTGIGSVHPLTDLHTSSYSMYLNNGYCEQTTGYATFSGIVCDKCEFRFEVKKVTCVKVNNQNVYQVEFAAINPYGTVAWATFTVPNGEGSFTSNTLSIPPGVSNQILYFNGQLGFNGGPVTIHVTASHDGKDCTQDFTIGFPESCASVEECRFGYKVGKTSCVKTETTNIYRFELEITNPYAINATTTVSVPSTVGIIAPASITSPSGILLHNFYFYPAVGWSGSGITVTVNSTIGNVTCTKYFDVKLPSDCSEVKKCEFRYEIRSVECRQMSNGQYGYTVTMIAFNPYGTPATISITAPNNEGIFSPAVLNLPPDYTAQTFDFYPSAGFMGGTINASIEGHYKDQICINDYRLEFPRLCCPTCKAVDLDDPSVTGKNLLVVAPNPANEITTIYYNFVETGGSKTIVLTDILGRTLLEWHPTAAKGTIDVDCSRYAQGHYLIVMKQDENLLENTKLIKH